MSKPDKHIDELGAILRGFRNEIQRSDRMIRLDGNAKTLPDIDMAVEVVKKATDTAAERIEDFYRNKILEARKETAEWAVHFVDKIETDNPAPNDMWRTFKFIRNGMRDEFKRAYGVDPAPKYDPAKANITVQFNSKEE